MKTERVVCIDAGPDPIGLIRGKIYNVLGHSNCPVCGGSTLFLNTQSQRQTKCGYCKHYNPAANEYRVVRFVPIVEDEEIAYELLSSTEVLKDYVKERIDIPIKETVEP